MAKTMKASFRNQRAGTSAKHNDRTNTINAKHIDANKISEDLFYVVNETFDDFDPIEPGKGKTTEEELKRYELLFLGAIEEQNKRNIAAGHKERNKSVEDYYFRGKTKPDETVLQCGKEGETISREEIMKVFKKYLFLVNTKFPNMKVISFQFHFDETTPHIHMRETFIDNNGRCNQTQAIKDMGYERPDLSSKEGRYNNVKIPFTDDLRELWYVTLEQELGIHIDRVVKNPSQRHKTKLEHENEVLEAENDTLKQQLEITREKCVVNENKAKKARDEAEEEAKKAEMLLKKNREQEEAIKRNQIIIDGQRNEIETLNKEKEEIIKENNDLRQLVQKLKGFLENLIHNLKPINMTFNKDEETNKLIDILQNITLPNSNKTLFSYLSKDISNVAINARKEIDRFESEEEELTL